MTNDKTILTKVEKNQILYQFNHLDPIIHHRLHKSHPLLAKDSHQSHLYSHDLSHEYESHIQGRIYFIREVFWYNGLLWGCI